MEKRVDIARSLTQVILAPLALMILFGVLLSWQLQRLPEVRRLVDHTNAVISQIRQTQRAHFAASAELRGYLLTRSDSFKEDYERRKARLSDAVNQLLSLTTDNPQQMYRAEQIRKLSSNWERFAETSVTQMVSSPNPIDPLQVQHGKSIVDSIDDILDEMEAEEQLLLQQRYGRVQETSSLIVASGFVLSLMMGAAMALFGFRTVRRVADQYSQALDTTAAARQKLAEANERLEQRVEERTAELTHTNAALSEEIESRIQTEAQLKETADQLRRSNRELEDFAYVASHDLQEPLRKIRAFGDRLQARYADALPPEASDYLGRMHAAAGRMQRLIEDLLSFSRVTTRAQPFQATDLNLILRDTLSDLEARIEETSAEIEVGDLPEIECDRSQMSQVFQNLVANSLKFQPQGQKPELEISSESSSPQGDETVTHIVLRFRDNGIGFDEKYLDRIFTPFQRLHGRNEYEGTGIGLAVCRKIVERHRGTITAQSAPGEGTTFALRLPVKQETQAEA